MLQRVLTQWFVLKMLVAVLKEKTKKSWGDYHVQDTCYFGNPQSKLPVYVSDSIEEITKTPFWISVKRGIWIIGLCNARQAGFFFVCISSCGIVFYHWLPQISFYPYSIVPIFSSEYFFLWLLAKGQLHFLQFFRVISLWVCVSEWKVTWHPPSRT